MGTGALLGEGFAPSVHGTLIDVLRNAIGYTMDHPLLGALAALAVLVTCVRKVRAFIHGLHPNDDNRRFSRADKAAILARAGGRCEHHSAVQGRCTHTESLEADHVHPHSRGGWTAVANGQALCRRHNKSKSARVPWNWELTRLSRRRAAYFPPGTPTHVTRHRPRSIASTPPRTASTE